jgi:hypothetical protein
MEMNRFNAEWVDLCIANVRRIRDSGVLARMDRAIRDEGAHLLYPMPIPLIYDRDAYETMRHGCAGIARIQNRIIRTMLSTLGKEGVCDYFQLPQPLRRFIDWDELIEQKYVIARYDLLPTASGIGQICEINSGTLCGGLVAFWLLKPYIDTLGLPLAQTDLAPFELAAATFAQLVRDKGLSKVVVVMLRKHEYTGLITIRLYLEYFRLAMPGIDIVLTNEVDCPRELLEPGCGTHIGVFRVFTADDIMEDLPFFERMHASGATIFSGTEADILSSKRWMALFFDELWRRDLAQEDLDLISLMVPLSHDIDADNVERLIAEKDAYVFKLNQSKGGAGVHVGRERQPAELRALLDTHENDWCAQAMVDCPSIDLPVVGQRGKHAHHAVFGMFHFQQHVCGIYVRASASSRIVNVATGACDSWAFPVTPVERELLLRTAFQPATEAINAR